MRSNLGLCISLILCACAPKTGGDPTGADTGTDSDNGGTGDTGDTGGTGDTSDTGDTGDTGDTSDDPPTTTVTPTGGETCEDPTVPVGPAVQIKIRNASPTSRTHVSAQVSCEVVSPFQITGPDDTPVKVDFDAFEFLCAAVQGDERCGRNPGCPVAGFVTQFDPGATLTLPWSGGSFTMAELSPTCADQFCGGCFIAQQVPAGAYKVQVLYSQAITGCTRDDCTNCQPEMGGVCTTEGILNQPSVAEAVFNYPEETVVEVLIE